MVKMVLNPLSQREHGFKSSRVEAAIDLSCLQSFTSQSPPSSDGQPKNLKAVIFKGRILVWAVHARIARRNSLEIMPRLKRVFAYRDSGSMGPTRWAPRRTVCTDTEDHSDLPGSLYVAKFCQGQTGAAAMISEVVCRELLRASGLHVLDAVEVKVSTNFAESWNNSNELEGRIREGIYFGTVYVPDVYGGSIDSLQQAENPRQFALIWLVDCLVCTIDRPVRGNLMLLPRGKPPKFRVIAADNSDCFCGSQAFSDGSWRASMTTRRAAGGVLVPEAIAEIGGEIGLRIGLQAVQAALGSLGNAFDEVPPEWWATARIQPEQIEESLWNRMQRLADLINVSQWGGGPTNGDFGEIPILQL